MLSQTKLLSRYPASACFFWLFIQVDLASQRAVPNSTQFLSPYSGADAASSPTAPFLEKEADVLPEPMNVFLEPEPDAFLREPDNVQTEEIQFSQMCSKVYVPSCWLYVHRTRIGHLPSSYKHCGQLASFTVIHAY